MWWKSSIALGLGLLLAAGGWWYMQTLHPYDAAIAHCAEIQGTDDERLDCWYQIMEHVLRTEGLDSAFAAFARVYETQPLFAQTGCHRHAHRLGDIVYYEWYRGAGIPLEDLNFPDSSTSCGYGFYHGFIEHLIQDNPTIEFVTDTCTTLTEVYGARMGSIQSTCYHGAGHGLLLATAEDLPLSAWGNMYAFVTEPLRQCDLLPLARPHDKDECKQGLFNIIVDWMQDGEYGFVYNKADPFAPCPKTPYAWKSACYYEMAQKLDGVSGYNPANLVAIVEKEPVEELRMMAFYVGMAGMMQHIAGSDDHYALFDQCLSLPTAYRPACVNSIVSGLFEHGAPREEHTEAVRFCSSEVIQSAALADACWDITARKLKRFHGDAASTFCALFPKEQRDRCEASVVEGEGGA